MKPWIVIFFGLSCLSFAIGCNDWTLGLGFWGVAIAVMGFVSWASRRWGRE